MPLGLTLGLGVGIPTAVLALVDANKSIDKAWANRNSEPEQLLAVTMCLFGDAGVGAVSGLAGAAASKAIQRIDSDRLAANIVRFLKEEDGSLPINVDDWPFGNSQSKKIAEGFGKAAEPDSPPIRLTPSKNFNQQSHGGRAKQYLEELTGEKIPHKLKTPAGQQAVLEGWERQIANGTLESKGRMIDPKRPHQGPFDVFEGAGFTLQRDLDGNLRSVHRTTSAMAQRFVCFGG